MVIAGRLIQGAAGATILACGLSLLTVATSGDATAEVRVAVGRRRRGRRSRRAAARRRPRGHHRLAGSVLDRRGGRRRLHGADLRDGPGVARRGAATLDRLPRHRADRAHARAADLRLHQERRLGLDLRRDARLLRRLDRRRLPLRRDRAAGLGAAARPRAAAQPDPGRLDPGDPHRRRHDQRADVPAEPLLPEPRGARLQPARGRRGDAAGHGRPGRGRPARAEARQPARRPPGDRRRLHRDGRRVRGRSGLVDSAWAYTAFLLPILAIAVGMGLTQRSRVVGRDRVRPAGAGRRGLRGLQHGAVRRRGGRDRPVRHDLRQRPEQPARRRRQRRRRPGLGPGRRLVADGRDQRPRHPPRPGRDPPAQGGRGHRSGRRRLGRRAPAHDPDHCLGRAGHERGPLHAGRLRRADGAGRGRRRGRRRRRRAGDARPGPGVADRLPADRDHRAADGARPHHRPRADPAGADPGAAGHRARRRHRRHHRSSTGSTAPTRTPRRARCCVPTVATRSPTARGPCTCWLSRQCCRTRRTTR